MIGIISGKSVFGFLPLLEKKERKSKWLILAVFRVLIELMNRIINRLNLWDRLFFHDQQ